MASRVAETLVYSAGMARFWPFVLVGAGSAIGGMLRFAVGRAIGGGAGGFPLSTFLINVSGSFVLGLLGGIVTHRGGGGFDADAVRLAIGVGFCGGFTTFSAFEIETHNLLAGGARFVATAYVVLSVAIGLLAVRAGLAAARWL
jgi:fluoride exporter